MTGTRIGSFILGSTARGQGYDATSHFVSEIGNFWTTPLASVEGTSAEVEFEYNASNWWLYLNGAAAGYFPGTEWSGAFTTSSVTRCSVRSTYEGTFYPTLNGTVSGYGSSGGGHLFFTRRTTRMSCPTPPQRASLPRGLCPNLPASFSSPSLPPACSPTLGDGDDKRRRAACTRTTHSPVLLLVPLPQQARGCSFGLA